VDGRARFLRRPLKARTSGGASEDAQTPGTLSICVKHYISIGLGSLPLTTDY